MYENIDQILGHILNGKASADDYVAFSQWLNEDADNKILFRQMKSYWDAEVAFSTTVSPAVKFTELKQQLLRQKRARRIKLITHFSVPVAAAILFIVVLFTHTAKEKSVQTTQEYYTYIADQNRTTFSLSDGSKIILNRNSRLTFSNDFGKSQRKVKLQGEAFFEVRKNPDCPFIVDMGQGATIRVLGTKFSATNHSEENWVETILLEGSILFAHRDQQMILSPNQKLSLSKSGKKLAVATVNAEDCIAWKDGLIKYRSIALAKLVDQLQQRYGVAIRMTSRTLLDPNMTVSGTFRDDQSLSEILNIIAKSLPIRWTLRNNKYYVELNQ